MPSSNTSPNALPDYDEAERALFERLRKLSTETDLIEGYKQPHSLRLASLVDAVGQRLGLHSLDLMALKFAALAHDFGERKMRRDYLSRPSALNWEEQLDLWRHPIIGEQEAQELKLPRQTQLLVRWHHEWWNGTGYPDGLAGTAIPLGARILRTIDTYCALTSERPYRGAYDGLAAEQTLAEQAGIECDPQVVKALLAHLADERLAHERKAADEQSYETVPMEVVRVDSPADEAFSAAHNESSSNVFNVIDMPQRETPAHAPSVTEDLSVGAPAAPTGPPADEVEDEVVNERQASGLPAPPVPPPLPLWERLADNASREPAVPASDLSPLDDSPEATDLNNPIAHFGFAPVNANVLPRTIDLSPVTESPAEWTPATGFAPTEEVPALTAADLAAALATTEHPSLGPVANFSADETASTFEKVDAVGELDKVCAAAHSNAPSVESAVPELAQSGNHLQVVALSDVPDHFWLVAKWIYEEWWETPDNSISLVSNPLKEHLASTTVPQTLVAMFDGQPVGSISLVENDLRERRELTPWLGSLYVLPQFREQGIGTRLLQNAFGRAKLQGAEAVYLATPGHTDFFSRLGWQVLERDVGPRRLFVMMRVS